jgi:hypothetical protein
VTHKQLPDDPWQADAPIEPGSIWDRLADRAYTGARDGNLSPDAAFDFASFLMDWATPNPLFIELAEASVEGNDPARLANLTRRALDAVDYVPDFAVEPRLLAALQQLLEVAVRDLRATGLDGQARLVLLEGGQPARAYLQYEGSYASTSGLGPSDAAGRGNPADTLVLVADELQDAVMDSLVAAWPVCPSHHFGAHARVADDHAVWWCKGSQGHVIAAIGRWGARLFRGLRSVADVIDEQEPRKRGANHQRRNADLQLPHRDRNAENQHAERRQYCEGKPPAAALGGPAERRHARQPEPPDDYHRNRDEQVAKGTAYIELLASDYRGCRLRCQLTSVPSRVERKSLASVRASARGCQPTTSF